MIRHLPLILLLSCAATAIADAENNTIAEDDASQGAYNGGWSDGSNGGNGFGKWTFTTEGNDNDSHSGFFIAETKDKPDLKEIARNDKAFGLYANGSGFEQAVAYRPLEKPLTIADSFSFMMGNGPFEKKFDKEDPGGGSIGLVLRSGNATGSTSDYNTGSLFEFGCYQGKGNYQIFDGSDNTDSGVACSDHGVSVSVTLTGPDSYDLQIQTMRDKNVINLKGRKLKASGAIESFAIFDRNGEKYDAFFNQFQVAHEEK